MMIDAVLQALVSAGVPVEIPLCAYVLCLIWVITGHVRATTVPEKDDSSVKTGLEWSRQALLG